MSKRTRHLALIILTQVSCLAVGLWMQLRFVQSSAVEEATNHAWSDMAAVARGLLAKLENESVAKLTPGSAAHDRIQQKLDETSLLSGRAMVVDADWKVLVAPKSGDGDGSSSFSFGSSISWTELPPSPGAVTTDKRIMLELPDGDRLAVAYELRDKQGYVVAVRSQTEIEAAVNSLLSSMPAISGLALVWTSALLGISSYMILARFHDEVEQERARTRAESLRQQQDLTRTRDAIVFGLAKIADSRDPETGDHLERISVYSTTLALALRRHPKFKDQVTPAFVKLIEISSVLHDIGKVGIEDQILLKPGKLTPDERKKMEVHPLIGGECLQQIEQRLGGSNFLQMAREIAFYHHERWDGTGYPRGLKGEEIPLAARIVAITDVYDALSSRRVYKSPQAHGECVDVIREGAGKRFDPDLVEAWLSAHQRFAEIARRYGDESPTPEEANLQQQETNIPTTVRKRKMEEVLISSSQGEQGPGARG